MYLSFVASHNAFSLFPAWISSEKPVLVEALSMYWSLSPLCNAFSLFPCEALATVLGRDDPNARGRTKSLLVRGTAVPSLQLRTRKRACPTLECLVGRVGVSLTCRCCEHVFFRCLWSTGRDPDRKNPIYSCDLLKGQQCAIVLDSRLSSAAFKEVFPFVSSLLFWSCSAKHSYVPHKFLRLIKFRISDVEFFSHQDKQTKN